MEGIQIMKVKQTIDILVITFILVVIVLSVVFPIMSLEHYNRVKDNPLVVTATVTSHSEYDDDGDTKYRSHVSYTVNGVRYTDKEYQDENERHLLTPRGTQVTIYVSPEKPDVQLQELEQNGRVMYFSPLAVAYFVAYVWKTIFKYKRSNNVFHVPETETIKKDAKLTIIGNFHLAFWLMLSATYAFCVFRYPTVLKNNIMLCVIAITAIIWIWRVICALHNFSLINKDEFEIRHDVLIKKEIYSGDDSDTYELTYRSGDKTWKTKTNYRNYNKSKEGDRVISLFLPNRKKPLMHYDSSGDAS